MRAAWDEYKVMGMASYGDPGRFESQFCLLVELLPEGRYRTHRVVPIVPNLHQNSAERKAE